MISLERINKTFRVARRDAGFRHAVKALFHREYTDIHALQDVSFHISQGEMVGYIGPNGAGKSSTIKIMSGILNPDSGSCRINGLIPWKNRQEHVRNIGVVFGQRSQLWWDVPVVDSFELIRDIYKVPQSTYQKNRDRLTEQFGLGEILRTPARQLSLGQRMRCEIAASLLHDPAVLFLDEPTIGLDAVSKIAVRRLIREINREKKTTVILTTHDMQDIEAIASRVLLIGKGQILLDGSLSQLLARKGSVKTITLQYGSGQFLPVPGLVVKEVQEGQAVFTVDTAQLSVSDAIAVLSQQADITDLSVAGSSTEELVVSLYEEFHI